MQKYSTKDGSLAVEGAWVICAPPNYAPDIILVQTMYDVIVDALNNLYIPDKTQPFRRRHSSASQQFSMNQWVNQGFYVRTVSTTLRFHRSRTAAPTVHRDEESPGQGHR